MAGDRRDGRGAVNDIDRAEGAVIRGVCYGLLIEAVIGAVLWVAWWIL